MDFLRQLAAPFFTLHQSLRKNAGIAVALAASAAVVTACALILPAATMDRQDRSTSPSPRLTAAQQEHLRCDQKNRSATKGGGWSPGERSSTKTGSNDSSVSPAEKSIPTDAHAAEKHRTPGGTKKTGGTASGASATSSTGSDAMKNAASAGSVTHEGDAGQTKADAGIQSAGSAKNQKTTKESAGTEPSISEIISKKGSTQKHVSLSGDVILSANGEGYKVKVYFGKFAEIPEGSILSIKKLSHDSGEYKSAQDAMIKTKKKADADFDKASLGLTALDITVSDAEGHTVEPKGKVGVRIEMDDMSKVADLPGTLDIDSLQVAHIKDNGAEILADTADKTKGSFDIAEDGSAVVTFNTASFSTYALVYQAMANQSDSSGTTRNMTVGDTQTLSGTTGSSYTVKVGETVTITPSDLSNGKKGNEYTWSSSSTSIATVTSGTSSTTVTGVSEGTVTITLSHKYKEKNKDPWSTEIKTYTVQVTDDSAADKTYTASDGSPKVTVHGNTKALNGYEVRIATTNSTSYLSKYLSDMNSAGASSDTLSSTSDFDFLQFYRIYLVDSSGNDVEPKTVDGQKVNLQVTLDYSNVGIPAGWSSAVSKGVWVGHYSTDGTTKKDISSDGNSFGTGVKKLTVTKVNGDSEALTGAKFKLKNNEGKYYTVTGEGTSKVVSFGEEASATEVAADGGASHNVATFEGLPAGEYTLIESTVPSGYTKAADKTITVSGSTYTEENLSQKETVENTAGGTLPSTGGIGTYVFYAVGAALIAGAVSMMIRRKKQNA